MVAIGRTFKDLLTDESGATAVEYGLIAGLIVIALIAGITATADANNSNYELIEEQLVG